MNDEFYYVAERGMSGEPDYFNVKIHGPFPHIKPCIELYKQIMGAPDGRLAAIGMWSVLYGTLEPIPTSEIGSALRVSEFVMPACHMQFNRAFLEVFPTLVTTVMVDDE